MVLMLRWCMVFGIMCKKLRVKIVLSVEVIVCVWRELENMF